MKRFFIALCVFCLTAVFVSAEEPELIERPLSWTIDSIQIVWNIEEQELEKYELRSRSDRVKSTSVENTQLSRETEKTTVDTSAYASADAEASISGGLGFSIKSLKKWGLQGSLGVKGGLGINWNKSTEKIHQNEWVKSENTTSRVSVSEESSKNNVTNKYNRKLLFTVNFENHSEDPLIFDSRFANTIPIYCEGEHLGDARPINIGFSIPESTEETYPCQFEMDLDDSGKTKLLKSEPDIRIRNSQIKIRKENSNNSFDAFTQSFKIIPHFIVRLITDEASREWEFKYDKKNQYKLQEVLATINEDGGWDDKLFELDDDGTILSVAGVPFKPSKDLEGFVLLAWNGKPLTDLEEFKPRKNSILDVILVSRTILETRQSDSLVTLIPFKETLEKWAKEGLFDGKYLAWNLMDKAERLAEIKRLAEAGDEEMQRKLDLQRKAEDAENKREQALQKEAGERKVLTADGIEYTFCWCPPGEFMMGGETPENSAKPIHKVSFTNGFWLLETEVTQEMWQSVMGNNPSNHRGPKNPVEQVSWNDCQEFCQKLSQKLGRTVKLPTEAQWEYACRADMFAIYSEELDSMTWHPKFEDAFTSPVGQKKPNSWGLYDMLGNVNEWCSDWYDREYYSSPQSDPSGPQRGEFRVIRGLYTPFADTVCKKVCNPFANRFGNKPDSQAKFLGFRILLVPNPEE